MPPPGRCWARTEDAFKAIDAENRPWWGPAGDRRPRLKMFLTEADDGVFATTLWPSGGAFGCHHDGIREIRSLGSTFATTTLARLMTSVYHIATNAWGLVPDSSPAPGPT